MLSSPTSAATETYDPASTKQDSDVIISRHSFQTDGLEYVQLFNNGSNLQSLEGWKLVYNFHYSDSSPAVSDKVTVALSGQLKPYDYLLISGTSGSHKPYVPGGDFSFDVSQDLDRVVGDSIKLVPSGASSFMSESIELETGKHTGQWRKNSSSTSSNSYTSTYKEYKSDEVAGLVLYGHGLYNLPAQPGLQVSTVLAHSNDCSPSDTSLGCRDYVKFYNPTSKSVDLADYALHYGSSTADHTVAINGLIAAKSYLVVDSDATGKSISLTNSGGFIWLTDKYNLKVYDDSILEYPSMSSSATTGHGWAQKSGSQYNWTNILTTGHNKFPKYPDIVGRDALAACGADQYRSADTGRCRHKTSASSDLKPCRSDQYRSTETNRCRKKGSTSSLVPCKPGQYRSSQTNRCRSSSTASAKLKPCAANQYRNPETNRCRLKSSKAGELQPCGPGKERNPATNRCRQTHDEMPKAGYGVEKVAQAGSEFVGWWALGGVAAAAVGYAGWEWRRELGAELGKIGRFLSIHK
ncbi:MAG: hypothetical protein L0H38_02445 [bacterium]|nr:hypothetical protein [bacterium]